MLPAFTVSRLVSAEVARVAEYSSYERHIPKYDLINDTMRKQKTDELTTKEMSDEEDPIMIRWSRNDFPLRWFDAKRRGDYFFGLLWIHTKHISLWPVATALVWFEQLGNRNNTCLQNFRWLSFRFGCGRHWRQTPTPNECQTIDESQTKKIRFISDIIIAFPGFEP